MRVISNVRVAWSSKSNSPRPSRITGRGAPPSIAKFEKQADGVLFALSSGALQLKIYSEDVIRVTYSKSIDLPSLKSFTVIAKPDANVKWNLTGPGKEVWRFGDETSARLINFINLRYRLLPYIYSVSWQVTNSGYTMMRPLVMDFPTDAKGEGAGRWSALIENLSRA